MAKSARHQPHLNRRDRIDNANYTDVPVTIENVFNFQNDFFNDSDINNDLLLDANSNNNRLRNINTPIEQLNIDLKNNHKWLRVAHINARSIPGHISELTRLVTDTDLDIVGISETFIKDDTPLHKCNTDDYKLFTENRSHTTQGGVAFL